MTLLLVGSVNLVMILDAGFWILDFKAEYPYFIPAKDGIFDQHRVSSIQHRFASPAAYVSHRLVGLRRSFTILLLETRRKK
ncbi:MAG: hypothetical protein V2J65_06945 [Desulfobacteraceae bacterium]|nr:hypothetical protein [Desulfobacteraceae bacterium]